MIFVGNAAYNNLGHPVYSTGVNWARNTLGIVPFVYVAAQVWGAQGVLIGQMAGGAFVAIASFLLAQRLMKTARPLQTADILQAPIVKDQKAFTMHHGRH